jgi:hypothetical protein
MAVSLAAKSDTGDTSLEETYLSPVTYTTLMPYSQQNRWGALRTHGTNWRDDDVVTSHRATRMDTGRYLDLAALRATQDPLPSRKEAA